MNKCEGLSDEEIKDILEVEKEEAEQKLKPISIDVVGDKLWVPGYPLFFDKIEGAEELASHLRMNRVKIFRAKGLQELLCSDLDYDIDYKNKTWPGKK